MTLDTVEIHRIGQTSRSVWTRRTVTVGDESKNKRGVSKLKYPVEHGTATDWDDAWKGVDYLIVLVRGVGVDADSRTTATVNRDELRLTTSKQDSFQSVDCTRCCTKMQQCHFRRASKHRVLDRSADPHRRNPSAPFFTGLTVTTHRHACSVGV